jgi:hypothetical protein
MSLIARCLFKNGICLVQYVNPPTLHEIRIEINLFIYLFISNRFQHSASWAG